MEERDFISLKWGTLKSWKFVTPKCKELFKSYCDLGTSYSAMNTHDTPEQKKIICDIIDASNVESVYLDWDGVYVDRDAAKKYVLEYGAEKATI